ncbi:PEP-CTERM-box response regulator transcription factor [Pseudomaricurvus sp. HS19]|uniref:PEP-CTERM-box response regulator transcription factor n=1 Tax=Pseudomaricurvus sp. HS19 TaxID=2692626 RepID=UPI001369D0D0|nr:PEP-CTERM-box response regulator transcription factor [Pseudomaricurvus sp. HS19]MYM62012.1 PEP-CTERM-box response regulator transcription factor [Pseudomaricurvus sp. HS19]
MGSENRQLLIVEDDPGLQSQLRWCFDNYEVSVCSNRTDAIAAVRRCSPGVVLLDLGLPPDPGGVTEGMESLKQILSLAPATKIIIVTGTHDRENAVKAIGLGAYDFYQKPVEADILQLMVDRAYRVYELEQENRSLQTERRQGPLAEIVGASPQIEKICRTIEKVAPSNITTLLLGASGTGKEVFARALHNLSPRAKNRMVAINCAAIPENLLESELFGYEKGAFTGAAKQTQGKIEYADGGTLFLDEVGDLPLELQAKLLRFLQERVVERVGGRKEIPVDVRIICATHQDLTSHIRDGRFREDLFYRISEITVNIPPLCDREGDALLLARNFLNRYSTQLGRNIKGFTDEALHTIERYSWPGNVRELESRIKRAVVMADGSQITPEDLELEVTVEEPTPFNLKQIRENAEKNAILRALNHANNNISETAKNLGVTRPTLYNMLEKYNLKP